MLRIALITLGDPDRVTGGYLYHKRMAELAPEFDAHMEFVSFPDWPFPLPLVAALRVRETVARLAPDAVLLDSIAAAYWAGPGMRGNQAGKRGAAGHAGPALPKSAHAEPRVGSPNVALIAVLHQPPGGVGHSRLRAGIQRKLDASAYAKARRLIVASASLTDELASRGFPREVMRVVPPGKDLGSAGDIPGQDLRCGRRRSFLCVANWLEHKGIHDLLEAFARLPEDAATLHLVGKTDAVSEYENRLQTRLRQPDLTRRVVVHGLLDRDHLAAMYRDADVFVLASYQEAYGTAYSEALGAGLPVVGWRAGNLQHLIDDGVEGALVTTGDVGELAAALTRMADDDTLLRLMRAAAAKRGATLPSWRDSAQHFFEVVREAIS